MLISQIRFDKFKFTARIATVLCIKNVVFTKVYNDYALKRTIPAFIQAVVLEASQEKSTATSSLGINERLLGIDLTRNFPWISPHFSVSFTRLTRTRIRLEFPANSN